MRRIILVSSDWWAKTVAFSNLQKAMEYLEKEQGVIFLDSYRTITEKLKYENKITVKSHKGIFGEVAHTMQRIHLR